MNSLHRLAAFIPVTLSRLILQQRVMDAGVSNELYAATLFADISGFTVMSEDLASDGTRGAEEVNRVLQLTFTAMIDVIHGMGGAVAHFHGDAMAIYFPDENGTAAACAVSCAQQMQKMMLTHFQAIETHRPLGKDPNFPLTIKIGAGYGRCQELILGDEKSGFEFVLRGTAVEQAAEAEKHATAGQIIISHALYHKLETVKENCTLIKQTNSTFFLFNHHSPFDVSLDDSVQPVLDWGAYDEDALARLARIAPAFVPPSLHERLRGTSEAHLAEHRPVTSIFVQFEYENGRLQAYYQHVYAIVKRFGAENGRLNRVLTGDKGNQLHIMFGAPIAPDAPEQAIRCALALQRERPSYISEQRIGLAAGRAFAAPVGASIRSEYTVVGDVVNLSARLTAICENGRVLTDETTARRVRQSIEFSTVAPVHLKGKQGTMLPHYAMGDVATATQIQAYFGRWKKPLVGREKETAVMLSVMDKSWKGDLCVLSISGAIGAGKTRLLAAGVQEWLKNGGEGLVGLCQQHLSDTPFAAWRTIWQDFFGLLPTMSADKQAEIVIGRTQALLPDVSDDDIGLWGDVLGLPIVQTAVLTALSAESRQLRFFALARRCLHVAATTQPLLIVLEDIHWADQASLKLIDELAARLTNSPLLITLLFRPMDNLPLDALTKATTISIADLTPQDARQLMHQLTGEKSLPPLVERHLGLRDRDGRDSPVNPLFLEEALNMLTGAGVLQLNGRVQVDEKALATMPLPDNIYSLLLARLDRLPPIQRELLQIASVIGREFALGALDGITKEQDRDTLIQHLSGLSSEQMTQKIADDPESVYLFQHALTHEVAYESLPFSRRQILHTAVADWLEIQYADNLKPFCAALAYHYGHTDQHEKGLKYALAAANAARDIFANKEAVEFYTMAERHINVFGGAVVWETKTAVEIYLSRGKTHRLQGDFAESIKDAEMILTIVNDSSIASSAYNLIADVKYRQSNFVEVLRITKIIIEDITLVDCSHELATAYMWAGWASSAVQEYEHALEYLEKAQDICIVTNNRKRLARVLEGFSFTYYSQKKLRLALNTMQQSLDLSKNFSPPADIGMALSNIGLLQSLLGERQEAVNTFDQAIVIARETSPHFLTLALVNQAEVLCHLGKFKQASYYFEEAINTSSNPHVLIEANLLWGYEHDLALEKISEATKHFQAAESLINSDPDNYPEAVVRLQLGLCLIALRENNYQLAKTLIVSADALAMEKNFKWWLPAVKYTFALVLASNNNFEDALGNIKLGIEHVEQNGNPDYLPLLLLGASKLVTDQEQKLDFAQQATESIKKRSRFIDALNCYYDIGLIFTEYGDVNLAEKGKELQDLANDKILYLSQ